MSKYMKERVVLFTHAKIDKYYNYDSFVKDKWPLRYENIQNLDEITTNIYHWPALFLAPVLSKEKILNFFYNKIDLTNANNKYVFVFISPMSIKLLMSVLDDKIIDWLKTQVIYVPGKGSFDILLKYGIKSFIGESANLNGVFNKINNDFAEKINTHNLNIIICKSEQGDANKPDYLQNKLDKKLDIEDFVFYKQLDNENNFPVEWFDKYNLMQKDVGFYIILTSYNGAKAFIKNFNKYFSSLLNNNIIFEQTSFCVMNKKSQELLNNIGFNQVKVLDGNNLDKQLLCFVK